MSKGSARRKGEGFADGWDRIFGKKEEPEVPYEKRIWPDGPNFIMPAIKITKAELKALYGEPVSYRLDDAPDAQECARCGSTEHNAEYHGACKYCGSKTHSTDEACKPDARQHVRDVVAALAVPAHMVTSYEVPTATYEQMKTAGASRDVIGQVITRWINSMKSIAPQDKICQHCRYWYAPERSKNRCLNEDVHDMVNVGECFDFEPPADWGCMSWEAKV